jgi:hypothetical protein
MKGVIMKYMMKVTMPTESANLRIKDPQFGKKMHDLLAEIKAEGAYFTTFCGNRGCYVVVNMNDASQMVAIAEPFFLWLQADVEFLPVMTPDDLAKGGPSMEAAIKNWGK